MSSRFRLTLSRSLIALLFCGMGVLHLVLPGPFLKVMPPLLPFPYALVIISGLCEFAGGVGVLIERVRRAAGIGLLALLVAVFPANIYMFQQHWQVHGWDPAAVVLLLRLPLQFVLLWWVYRSTRPTPLSVEIPSPVS